MFNFNFTILRSNERKKLKTFILKLEINIRPKKREEMDKCACHIVKNVNNKEKSPTDKIHISNTIYLMEVKLP